ncbi:MAG: primosomal protein N', partial [Dehalococcoidia bacterium]
MPIGEMLAFAETLQRAPKQAALARRLAESPAPYLVSKARDEFGVSAVSGLVNKGFAAIGEEGHAQPPVPNPSQPQPLPTPAQAAALEAINAAQQDPSLDPRTCLLQGVTGSGKTEVYLQAIAHCLSSGKRALVLVPELSLTAQMVERFEARFPGQVGVLHSGLTPAQHWRQWWDAHQRKHGVIIGSRGAIFAPQPDLGLIVLDEEHEWTYKQTEAAPRYHARDVAERLAQLTGAVVVLGSATPDVATAYAAKQGRYLRLVLPHRIEASGAQTDMAGVDVVDMREELKRGNRDVFSAALREALSETVQDGKQALLFLNRRGAGNVVECRSCGYVVRCWRCSTPFTFHIGSAKEAHSGNAKEGQTSKGTLVCHHCNRRRNMPMTCPNCRSRRIRYLGLGTQRLTEEAQALLPNARVLRWDRDTASNASAHAELLRRL